MLFVLLWLQTQTNGSTNKVSQKKMQSIDFNREADQSKFMTN